MTGATFWTQAIPTINRWFAEPLLTVAGLIALAFVPLAQADEFQGMSPATPALTESRTPIPILTDADRAALKAWKPHVLALLAYQPPERVF